MTTTRVPKLVAVVGPTASGKTRLARSLSQRFTGEIIGVDASQIYRGFDVGTGKATTAELGGVRHHNLDIAAPTEDYNAARFVRDTRSVLKGVLEREQLPIFCGGTGLYFRALREGLCRAPKVPDGIRSAILAEMEEIGVERMHECLRQVDPTSAQRIHFRDKQRIERALSVYRFTNKPLSQWMQESAFPGLEGEWCVLGLRWDTLMLKSRIEKRVHQMVENGWLDEVRTIVEAGYSEQARAFSAIGYRFMLEVVEGKRTLEASIEETVRQTHKYAKRQMTWFRREHGVRWLDCPHDQEQAYEIVSTFLEARE